MMANSTRASNDGRRRRRSLRRRAKTTRRPSPTFLESTSAHAYLPAHSRHTRSPAAFWQRAVRRRRRPPSSTDRRGIAVFRRRRRASINQRFSTGSSRWHRPSCCRCIPRQYHRVKQSSGRAFARDPERSLVQATPLPGNILGQAAHTHVPLSPSSVIWYRPVWAVTLFGWEGNCRPGKK